MKSCFCFSLLPVFWKVNYSLTILSVKYQLPEVFTRQLRFQISARRRHSLTGKNTEGLEKHQPWVRSHTADCTMLKHFDLFSHASTLLKMRGLVFSCAFCKKEPFTKSKGSGVKDLKKSRCMNRDWLSYGELTGAVGKPLTTTSTTSSTWYSDIVSAGILNGIVTLYSDNPSLTLY